MNIEYAISRETDIRRKQVERLDFFDPNMWLGGFTEFPLAAPLQPSEISTHLNRFRYGGALLSHFDGVVISAQDGNAALIACSEVLPQNVYTIWTGLPLFPREQDPLPGVGCPHARMRGVRLYPKTHRYPLTSWVLDSLCNWLIEWSVPLFVQHVEVDWDDLFRLTKAHPDLTVVVESQWQKVLYHTRPLLALMKACDNVYLETSNCVGVGFMEQTVGDLGSKRLLFGSYAPVNDPLVAMGMIIEADLSDEEKADIAGGNARALIDRVKT